MPHASNGSTSAASINAQKLTKPLAETFWRAYDTFVFDADGVIWRGKRPIDGASEVIERLIGAGKRVLLLTNGANHSADDLMKKCTELGFKGLFVNLLSKNLAKNLNGCIENSFIGDLDYIPQRNFCLVKIFHFLHTFWREEYMA